MKKFGFTLSETLITLTIMGILAVLVLPGLVKDSANKANIALLQSSVSTLTDAIQNELLKKSTTDINDTDVIRNTQDFLSNNFEYAEISGAKAAKSNPYFKDTYQLLDGNSVTFPATTASVLLKNGVAVAISVVGNLSTNVYIDTNGLETPNVAGVDMFLLAINRDNDFDNAVHSGDLGCGYGPMDEFKGYELVQKCKESGEYSCYCALELSGFDPDYINYFKEKEE